MIFKKVYDFILQGDQASTVKAKEIARGMVFSEIETHESDIKYHNHIETIKGVGVYYDYGADYYFFVEEEETK